MMRLRGGKLVLSGGVPGIIEALQAFVRKVSTTYPVASFLRPEFAASVCFEQIKAGCAWTPEHFQEARNNFPALHALMGSIKAHVLPEELQAFLQEIQGRALRLLAAAPVRQTWVCPQE